MAGRLTFPACLLAGVGVMALARAWVSDDAFISFRVVEQMLAGHGPVFNVGERVQVFTHPLWFLVLAAWRALGASFFPGVTAVSMAFFAAGLFALGLAWRDRPWGLAVAAVLLLFSRSVTDFATSGLETPLSFALFALGLLAIRRERPWLAIAALALLPMNRLDLLPWALPFAWIAAPPRRRLTFVAILLVPAALWAAFSTVYYGAPLPNTALAKLGGHLPDAIDQGLAYVVGSLIGDPGALALAIFGPLFGWRAARTSPLARAALAAIAIDLAYVLACGGDFMLGRFLLPALWACVPALVEGFPAEFPTRERSAAAVLATLGAFHLITGNSATNLWTTMRPDSMLLASGFSGAVDERRNWMPWFGVWSHRPLDPLMRSSPAPGELPYLTAQLGYPAYFTDHARAQVDVYALSDPMLARETPLPFGRPGHAFRPSAREFLHWRDPAYRFGDAALDALAADLRLAHRSPDFLATERWAAIARLAVARPIAQDALRVADEGEATRIEVHPDRLYRGGTAERFVVWLRLVDWGGLRYHDILTRGVDRECREVAVPAAQSSVAGFEVGQGETLVLRCAKALLAGETLLLRVGALRGAAPEFDDAIPVVRPVLWWRTGLRRWLTNGWEERPRGAVVVAILLFVLAGALARRGIAAPAI